MERVAHAPREQWAARLEAQGFPFHSVDAEGTAQHDGRFHYWREDFAYRFEAAEIERMYEAAGELHAMALALVEDVVARGDYEAFALPEHAAGRVERSWRRHDVS